MQSKKPSSKPQTSSSLPDFPALEEEVLAFWEREDIFGKTIEQTKNGKPFIFFEGPPTANGKPGIHHVLARAFKDVIVRYQTMRGRYVARKAGWDTHGLPVELQVEKELGISGKKDIENIVPGDKRASIAEFNARSKTSVMSNILDWETLTKRIGYWLDFEHAYRTYTSDYIESLWWIIKEMSRKETPEGPLLYKGHKVVHHCPRCETALSSHEVAQGYKTVQDTSVYVKFRAVQSNVLKIQSLIESEKEVYLLSWTTTPWTLPGNVALAVKTSLDYALVKQKQEYYVVAKDRVASVFGEGTEIDLEFRGKDLIATEYEALFKDSVARGGSKSAWTVLPADFVTAVDGTGIVHTAVMYGEDDYQLGVKTGLPRQHTVTTAGRFTDQVKGFAGMFVKDAMTEKALITFLHEHNRLFKVEPMSHEYPFCWRCSTPLLYYAKDSWFVRMSSLRKELLKNNKAITWVPSHIKEGRFGEWLEEVKDWAFSRERYWGTPLPIWECSACGKKEVIGSVEELVSRAQPGTLPERSKTVYLIRHGRAQSNDEHVNGCLIEDDDFHVTPEGKKQVEAAAKKLKGKIDCIVTSDFLRTRETSDIIAKITGAEIIIDPRLRELRYPTLHKKPVKDVLEEFPENSMRLHHAPKNGETLLSVAGRIQEAIIDRVQQFPAKRLLFVSHGDPLWAYQFVHSKKKESELDSVPYPEHAKPITLALKKIPLNLHRPYIDSIQLTCDCSRGAVMRRIEEVADVWFDSGSMPFAQSHYPFEHEKEFHGKLLYPADYISEAIDQTRGWFYTLLAVSTVLGQGTSYKNVICLGHILDEKGEKMSKSKGNVVNPWDVMAQTGVDALRFHFYSMNQPGDTKLFHIDGVQEVVRKTLLVLWNVQSFYLLNAPKKIVEKRPSSDHPLDIWVMSRLEETREKVTGHLDAFHIFEASRELRDFVNDLSTWYVRRSRDRMREKDRNATQTLGYVLFVVMQLFAPFTPFTSEILYRRFSKQENGSSIHLTAWPAKKESQDRALVQEMKIAREIVELIHGIRKESNIKARQPLARANISAKIRPSVIELIQSEVNVDLIEVHNKPGESGQWKEKTKGDVTVAVDTTLTEELLSRGKVRELVRHINDLRKSARLTQDDAIDLYVLATPAMQEFMTSIKPEITEDTRMRTIHFEMPSDVEVKKNVQIEKETLTIGLIVRP